MRKEQEHVRENQGLGQDRSFSNTSIMAHSNFRQTTHSQHKHSGHRVVMPFLGTTREKREKLCIAKALVDVPHGTSVLNWPCECGRLLPFLKQLGYNVTSIDTSFHAVAQARFRGGFLGEGCIDDADDFQVVDLLQAGFGDDCFDAVIVNHLFCYFPESQMRQQVLKELGRICSGPIVVSFFHIVATAKMVRCEHQTRNNIPINRRKFSQEVGEYGLTVTKWVPKYSVISKQACAVITRNKGF